MDRVGLDVFFHDEGVAALQGANTDSRIKSVQDGATQEEKRLDRLNARAKV